MYGSKNGKFIVFWDASARDSDPNPGDLPVHLGFGSAWNFDAPTQFFSLYICVSRRAQLYIGLGVGIIRLSPHTGSILISKTETKLLIGCVKNPVGKATNGRNMKKVNWTGYISYINKFPMSPLP